MYIRKYPLQLNNRNDQKVALPPIEVFRKMPFASGDAHSAGRYWNRPENAVDIWGCSLRRAQEERGTSAC